MTSSFVHHFIATCEIKLELRFGNAIINAKFYSTSVIPKFDRWPWPFTWTSPLSAVMSVVNFMMIRKKEHYDISVTKKWTGRRTDIQHYTVGYSYVCENKNTTYGHIVAAKKNPLIREIVTEMMTTSPRIMGNIHRTLTVHPNPYMSWFKTSTWVKNALLQIIHLEEK